jgi:hypothetical protein
VELLVEQVRQLKLFFGIREFSFTPIMNKSEFIKQLKETAEALKPLTESIMHGTLTWNGTKYAKTESEGKKPEPYALAWWSILSTVAELIDGQETPLSEKQIAYLDRLLFGGMGSFNDLSFDPNLVGDIAKSINDRLDKERRALYASFKSA